MLKIAAGQEGGVSTPPQVASLLQGFQPLKSGANFFSTLSEGMNIFDTIARGWQQLGAGARRAWSWLRQVSGDAAYENYLRCARRHVLSGAAEGSAPVLLSPAEFYLDALRRRYSSISRCC